jgi:hypothetical protein
METSKTLTGQQLSDLTLFAVDTLANHSAPQENEKEQTTQDTCGLGCEPPLANYDPTTQSWRTSKDMSLWGDYKSLENLPKSGMTRNGALFQQPAWVRLIDATELLSWPTPTASDWKGRGPNSKQQGLPEVMKTRMGLWPTPRSSSAMAEDMDTIRERLNEGQEYKSRLEEAVAMWPTPTASSWGNEGSRKMLDKHVASGNITPEDKKAMTAGNGGKLNPTWVEWLMGFPIGWTDLED